MKRIQQDLLGVSAFRSTPESLDEFQKLTNGEALAYADSEAYYRGVAPKARAQFLANIKASLGLEPLVKSEETVGEGDKAKVVKTYEKDTAFIKRIKAAGTTQDQLTPLLQAAFDTVGYDLTSSRNTNATKKDLDDADFYIGAVAAGESTWDRVVANFEREVPGLQIDREDDGSVTRETMGEVCKAYRLQQAQTKML